MNPIEYHKNELKKLQDELALVRIELKRKQDKKELLINLIKNSIKSIDRLENGEDVRTDYVGRDLDLCEDFIRSNPGCSSRRIVNHLNDKLKGSHKRWKQLDTNIFMSSMGNYLKKTNKYIVESAIVDKRMTSTWTLK